MGRPRLRALAERLGILPGYRRSKGGAIRRSSDATRAALAGALGYDARDESAAAHSLERLRATARRGRRMRSGPLPRCAGPEEALGDRRGFGVTANLYSLRGPDGLGVGNLGDLRALVQLAASAGAAFVGISPLHATRNRGDEISPYAPTSRFFRNPIYLDVFDVPELADSAEAQALLDAPAVRDELRVLRDADRIDYARVARLQERLLRALHGAFAARHRGRDTPRGRAYADFHARRGPALLEFATFCALEAQLAGDGLPPDWRAWPPPLRDRNPAALAEFQRSHAEEVDYFAFLQFELDRQLAAVADAARRAGLAIGLYQDLALGSAASGFDTWALGEHFVPEVRIGAPPDAYSATGQDWGVPPLDPLRLEAEACGFWRALLSSSFEHAGALRIDHVLGLFRQWWIPAFARATEGAYVRFPTRDLLAATARESRRAGALVIGEDLGTVPPQVPAALARSGILSCRVLLFERDRAGRFRRAERYSRRALVSANTHDLPPLAGFWSGADIRLRRDLGLFADAAAHAAARSERASTRRALLRRLAADGLLPASGSEPSYPELCAAVHAFLCRTPAPLVAVSIDDLAAETEPVNLPGIGIERYPSWTRRMRRSLAELADDPALARGFAAVQSRSVRAR